MKLISVLLLVVVVSCSGGPRVEPTLPPLPLPTIPVVSVAQKPSEGVIRPDLGQVIPTTPTTTTTLPDTKCAEWYPLFVETGFDPALWDWANMVLWRESRCRPDAHNEKSNDLGLWQVNARSWCKPNKYNTHPAGWLGAQGIITDCEQLFDPATNMKAALAMYQYSENKNGTGMGWWPWRKTSG
jgi:hypothetical protein